MIYAIYEIQEEKNFLLTECLELFYFFLALFMIASISHVNNSTAPHTEREMMKP